MQDIFVVNLKYRRQIRNFARPLQGFDTNLLKDDILDVYMLVTEKILKK